MDSGNSGSLQSSSGGDEEYDSRAAGSVFMNAHVLGPISNPPPPPQFNFDPFSNYMQVHQPSMPWPRPTLFRSDPNSTTHRDINNNSMLSAGSSHFPVPLRPPPAVGEVNNSSSSGSGAVAPPATNHSAAARNPRKRSRASRRAPTTVLTTDATNFRAMVQEFTGIPAAPPFINNSLFRGSGLDLFGTRSAAFEAPKPPPYLRRPSVQKDLSPPQFLASSIAPDSGGIGGSSTANNDNNNSVSSTLSTQSWNLFNNVPNPLVTSLHHQTNPRYLSSNTSDQFAAQNDCCNNNNITDHNKNAAARRWRNSNGVMNPADHHDDDDYTQADHRLMKPVGGPHHLISRSTMNNGKMIYSGEKGPPENIASARGSEGIVESWINCSSSE